MKLGQKLLKQGRESFEAGKLEEAITLLLKASHSQLGPEDEYSAHAMLAISFLHIGRPDEAARISEIGISIIPSNETAYCLRCFALRAMGMPNDAARCVSSGMQACSGCRFLSEAMLDAALPYTWEVMGMRGVGCSLTVPSDCKLICRTVQLPAGSYVEPGFFGEQIDFSTIQFSGAPVLLLESAAARLSPKTQASSFVVVGVVTITPCCIEVLSNEFRAKASTMGLLWPHAKAALACPVCRAIASDSAQVPEGIMTYQCLFQQTEGNVLNKKEILASLPFPRIFCQRCFESVVRQDEIARPLLDRVCDSCGNAKPVHARLNEWHGSGRLAASRAMFSRMAAPDLVGTFTRADAAEVLFAQKNRNVGAATDAVDAFCRAAKLSTDFGQRTFAHLSDGDWIQFAAHMHTRVKTLLDTMKQDGVECVVNAAPRNSAPEESSYNLADLLSKLQFLKEQNHSMRQPVLLRIGEGTLLRMIAEEFLKWSRQPSVPSSLAHVVRFECLRWLYHLCDIHIFTKKLLQHQGNELLVAISDIIERLDLDVSLASEAIHCALHLLSKLFESAPISYLAHAYDIGVVSAVERVLHGRVHDRILPELGASLRVQAFCVLDTMLTISWQQRTREPQSLSLLAMIENINMQEVIVGVLHPLREAFVVYGLGCEPVPVAEIDERIKRMGLLGTSASITLLHKSSFVRWLVLGGQRRLQEDARLRQQLYETMASVSALCKYSAWLGLTELDALVEHVDKNAELIHRTGVVSKFRIPNFEAVPRIAENLKDDAIPCHDPLTAAGACKEATTSQCVQRRCSNCLRWEKDGAKLRKCSQCKIPLYCSLQCQKLDWKKGHRERCVVQTDVPNLAPSSGDFATPLSGNDLDLPSLWDHVERMWEFGRTPLPRVKPVTLGSGRPGFAIDTPEREGNPADPAQLQNAVKRMKKAATRDDMCEVVATCQWVREICVDNSESSGYLTELARVFLCSPQCLTKLREHLRDPNDPHHIFALQFSLACLGKSFIGLQAPDVAGLLESLCGCLLSRDLSGERSCSMEWQLVAELCRWGQSTFSLIKTFWMEHGGNDVFERHLNHLSSNANLIVDDVKNIDLLKLHSSSFISGHSWLWLLSAWSELLMSEAIPMGFKWKHLLNSQVGSKVCQIINVVSEKGYARLFEHHEPLGLSTLLFPLATVLLAVANLISTPTLPARLKQQMRNNSLLRMWAEVFSKVVPNNSSIGALHPLAISATSLLEFLNGHGSHEQVARITAVDIFSRTSCARCQKDLVSCAFPVRNCLKCKRVEYCSSDCAKAHRRIHKYQCSVIVQDS